MDNFNFNLFKYYYYVVLYGGVTNASKNLRVAQPSLSLSIKNLESQLNKQLIDRSSKHFLLTEEGKHLFNILKPMFESVEKNIHFEQETKKYSEINIGIRYSYAKSILFECIQMFQDEYPKVKLNIDLYSKLDFNKVKNGEYDIVIDDNDYIKQLENVIITTICHLPNYFVCGNKLYEEYKNVSSVEEIAETIFISQKPSLKTGKFREFCYKNNISFIEPISINESDLYYKLLIDNKGIGFSNKLLLKEYTDNKMLYKLNIKEKIFEDIISIACIKKDNIIDAFVKIVCAYIKKEME